jgi:hypothetical protein
MDADVAGYVDASRLDLRQTAADRAAPVDEDVVQVPATDAVADSVVWAKRVLDEVDARAAEDARMAEAERNVQLARWHADDHSDGDQASLDSAGADDPQILDHSDAL